MTKSRKKASGRKAGETSDSGVSQAASPSRRDGRKGTPATTSNGAQKAAGGDRAKPAKTGQKPKAKRGDASGKAPAKAQPTATPSRRYGGIVDQHSARESRRYDNPIASREAIRGFLESHGEAMSAEKLAEALGLAEGGLYGALAARLGAMLRDGELLIDRRGRYAPVDKLDLIPGVVLAKADGFGFLRPDAGGEDLFLSPSEMRRVMHGDRVLASVTGVDRRGRREGAIVEVLERGQQRLVGRFNQRGDVGLVVPDDRRISHEVIVAREDQGGARHNDVVVCEITAQPSRHEPPFGRVLAVLGERLTPSLAVEVAIHGHGLPVEWPEGVEAQAAAVDLEVSKKDRRERVDLRDLAFVTIDGADAKDFDDAVYCEADGRGFRLYVAIADVSHYVRPGTALDDEAYERATSVYFPGFVIPMLPETLSNGICSLNPKVDRLAFVAEIQIGADGSARAARFYEAVIHSKARLTYDEVHAAIGDRDAEVREQLGNVIADLDRLHDLYRVLGAARTRRGAIEFETTETDFRIGPAGEVVQAAPRTRNDAHRLIEECMIAANVAAARYLLQAGVPAPFRVHDRPPQSRYEDLLEFLREFGQKLPAWEKVEPRDFANLLKRIDGRDDEPLLQQVLLRSQSMAVYQPENIGHFGLALDAYAHFTSPIRRYPDLLVHRAIKHALAGGSDQDYRYPAHQMAQMARHCSTRERRADEAEREVDERLRCAFMERHIGQVFPGVVSGVTSFGLFVELDETRIQGLVHVTQLPSDYYHFEPTRKLLRGERTGAEYRLADAVRVQVLRASLEDRQIDFRLVEPGESPRQDKGAANPSAKAKSGKARPQARGKAASKAKVATSRGADPQAPGSKKRRPGKAAKRPSRQR